MKRKHEGEANRKRVRLEPGGNVQEILDRRLCEEVEKNNVHMVKDLLLAGANPNVLDSADEPLIFAAIYHDNSGEIVKALLNAGANVHARGMHETTCLHEVVVHKNKEPVIRLLCEAGADIDAIDGFGQSVGDCVQHAQYHVLLQRPEKRFASLEERNNVARFLSSVVPKTISRRSSDSSDVQTLAAYLGKEECATLGLICKGRLARERSKLPPCWVLELVADEGARGR